MLGQKFGRLVVLEEAGKNKYGNWRYLCQCTCGNFTTVFGSDLRNGHTKSCGCLKKEQWKGEDANYYTIHRWLRANKPKPELCERCKERPVEQLSYKYAYNSKEGKLWSRNPDDYEWLCMSCHFFKDQGNKAIMTKAKIHRIREFYAAKAAIQCELAELFKISQKTISYILNYKGIYQEL